jgi:hypothetical protein
LKIIIVGVEVCGGLAADPVGVYAPPYSFVNNKKEEFEESKIQRQEQIKKQKRR